MPVPHPPQVAPLTEETVEAGTCIFICTVVEREREAHLSRFSGNPEMIKQGREVRIIPLVINDEAGVDGNHAFGGLHVNGIGVTAKMTIGLIQRHAMTL